MANYTQEPVTDDKIRAEYNRLKVEDGIDSWELAKLNIEDLHRKGCLLKNVGIGDDCRGCPAFSDCPILSWQSRHPEYANDAMAKRIDELYGKNLDSTPADKVAKLAKEFEKLDVSDLLKNLKAAAADLNAAVSDMSPDQSDAELLKLLGKMATAMKNMTNNKLMPIADRARYI